MLKATLSLPIGLLIATPVYAETHGGDAIKGEAAFMKCKACTGIQRKKQFRNLQSMRSLA